MDDLKSSVLRRQRAAMVQEQLVDRGIQDARVLNAMSSVPREEFVPEPIKSKAYRNSPLPIGHDQTISQPYTVAFMCEALQLNSTDRVLEIGTGSGYGAAVLSQLAHSVYTIERIPELAIQAQKRLRRLGYDNVHVLIADGTLGLPSKAPFDGIIVTAGAEELPPAYLEQLADGGRIVIPIGPTPNRQSMFRVTKLGDEITVDDLGEFSFVPLVGKKGWPDTTR